MTHTARGRSPVRHRSWVTIVLLGLVWIIPGSPRAIAQQMPPCRPASAAATASLAPMLARVLPTVVSIRVVGRRQIPRPLAMAGTSSQPSDSNYETTLAGGSGVVIDAVRGLVVTNHHVTMNAASIEIELSDGRKLPGKVIGADPGTDISLLKIDGQLPSSIKLGNSDCLAVGDLVVTVGSPYGLQGSASLGIVSALNRSDLGASIFEDFIQTDAAINAGNSGGALVNVRGELVGINTASGGGRRPPAGIGFAVPSRVALSVADQLLARGKVVRGAIGFGTEALTSERARQLDLPFSSGLLVIAVGRGSPAERTGYTLGAVIRTVDGRAIRTRSEYIGLLATKSVGDEVALEIHASGKTDTVRVRMALFEINPPATIIPEQSGVLGGIAVGELLPSFPAYGSVRGVRILDIPDGSKASAAGLRKDDVIMDIDGTPVGTVDDLVKTLRATTNAMRVSIQRGEALYWAEVR
jgi:serine protease DegQ